MPKNEDASEDGGLSTLDQVIQAFEGDPNWQLYNQPASIIDLVETDVM